MSYLSDSLRYASISDSATASIPITSLVFERYDLNSESLAENSESGYARNRYSETDTEQRLIDRVNDRYSARAYAKNRYARGGTNGFPGENSYDQYGSAYDDDYTGKSLGEVPPQYFRGGNDTPIISLGDDLQSVNFNIKEQIKYENTEEPSRYQDGGEDWPEEDLHEYGYKYQHGGNPDISNAETVGTIDSIASLSNVDFDLKKQLRSALTETESASQTQSEMKGGNRYRMRSGNRYRMRGGNDSHSNSYRMRGGNESLTNTYDNNGFDDVGYRTEEYRNSDYNTYSAHGGNSVGQPSLSEVEVNFMNVFNRAKAHVEKIYGKVNQNHEYEHGSLQDLNSLNAQTGGARAKSRSRSKSKNTKSKSRSRKDKENPLDFYREIAKILHQNSKYKDISWAHKVGIAGKIIAHAKTGKDGKHNPNFKKDAIEIAKSEAAAPIIAKYKKDKGL